MSALAKYTPNDLFTSIRSQYSVITFYVYTFTIKQLGPIWDTAIKCKGGSEVLPRYIQAILLHLKKRDSALRSVMLSCFKKYNKNTLRGWWPFVSVI